MRGVFRWLTVGSIALLLGFASGGCGDGADEGDDATVTADQGDGSGDTDQTSTPDEPGTVPEPGQEQAQVPAAPVGWSDAPVPECDAPADQALGPDGVLWVGSLGLFRWDGEWAYFTHEEGLPAGPDFDPDPEFPSGGPCGPDSRAPWVGDVEVGPDGTLWMANGAGISSYDGAEFAVVAQYPGGMVPETFDGYLRVDGNGDVWFPTFERIENPTDEIVTEPLTGVARLDGGTWTEFPLGATADSEGSPLVGDDGSVYWVGSEEVYELADGTWTAVDVTELLALGSLFDENATVGPDGSLWIAVWGSDAVSALARRADGGWTIHADGLPPLFGQLIVAPDGTLWAPLWGPDTLEAAGLAAFDGTTWSLHEVDGVEPTCPPFWTMADGTSIWVRGPWCSSLRYTPTT